MNNRFVRVGTAAAALLGVGAAVDLSGAGVGRDAGQLPRQAKVTEAAVATIPVKGMFCLSCAATIKHKVSSLNGVLSAQVSLTDQAVRIRYTAGDPTIPAKAAAAIDSLGYKAGKPV